MKYRFRAISRSGEPTAGELDAVSRDAVAEFIRGRGLLPVDIEAVEAGLPPRRTSVLPQLWWKGRRRLIARFVDQLAILLAAGLPLATALGTMTRSANNQRYGELCNEMAHDIGRGESLAEAAAHHDEFDAFCETMMRAGERGGELERTLRILADYLDIEVRLHSEIVSAIAYPVILLVVSLLSFLFICIIVIPEFHVLLADTMDTLPLFVNAVLATCLLVADYWWAIAAAIVALIVLTLRLLHRPAYRRRMDTFALRLPFLGLLVIAIEMGRFARAWGVLTSNGVPLADGMSLSLTGISNTELRHELMAALDEIKSGRAVAAALAHAPRLPDYVVPIVAAGEAGGTVGEALLKIADVLDRDARNNLERAILILEPILIIGMGILIGLLIVSVLTAILSLNEIAV